MFGGWIVGAGVGVQAPSFLLPAAASPVSCPPHTCPVSPRRASGLPEKYCVEAERKANILPAASVN